jgi:ribonucleoside-diphosphate reductase beta chain
VRFFNRFYRDVGVLEADTLQGRLAETSEHVNPEFDELFDEMLKSRVERLARHPHDLEALVEAVTLYHMVIEGMLALTGQHFILQYNEEVGTLPGFVRASTRSPATSTVTSPSGRAFYARWRPRTRSTATR